MRERSDQIAPEAVEAMHAVLSGAPAIEAWLDYVRRLYPGVIDALARIAVAHMAIDLLRDNGDLSIEDAERQRKEAADTVAAKMPFFVWEEIHELRATLEALDAHMKRRPRGKVLDLEETSFHERIRAS